MTPLLRGLRNPFTRSVQSSPVILSDQSEGPATPPLRRVELIMGMPIEIEVHDPGVEPDRLNAAFDWFRRVDEIFSTYKRESQISRISRGELEPDEADGDVRAVLERCEELAVETKGYFDIHLAQGIDPSGLVKGWSVDRAGALLQAQGIANFCINAGGDVLIRGAPGCGSRWRIGIRHPIEHDKLAKVVVGNDLAIATSGEYERGRHIVDPRTGRPPDGVLSVTIAGPELGTADAYATAAFAMGTGAADWIGRLDSYDGMVILADQTVLLTPTFPDEAVFGY
ncbi:MAG TPA: FAD:protein FMN transferase [Chloroflexota bacterium]|nr:FAD:protein FMN transferase [Chloroflexota bacterium]